jgi:hypothetical protein
VAAELLATDRALGRSAGDTDLVSAIVRMLHPNVTVLAPTGLARGIDESRAALLKNPDNAKSRMTWTPVRAGVSADGQDGFTLGFFTVITPSGQSLPGKYLAYWRRTSNGWRVAAYKRRLRPAGDVPLAEWAPVLPPRMLLVSGDSARTRRFAQELDSTERAFSRDGQSGIGQAFLKYADAEAAHIGGPASADFVRGPEAISKDVAAGASPTVTLMWAPENVLVSSSGDLGVTIGSITVTPEGKAPQAIPFFTIWRRSSPAAPWRYVAE